MKFDHPAPRRLPWPIRLVVIPAGISAGAIITVGGLMGLPVFPSDIDNSRKNEVVGCYFIANDLVAKIDKDRISFAGNSSHYDLVSDKAGLAILPPMLLRARTDPVGWQIIHVQGRAEFVPVTGAGLNLLTIDGSSISALKKPCRVMR